MSITASTIIGRVRTTLLDPEVSGDGRYWLNSELIDYINAAITYIIGIKPDASSTVGSVPMVAGIDQQLPAGALQFLRPLFNTSSKRAALNRDFEKMTQANPMWPAATEMTDVYHVFPDNIDPTRFRVNPPNDGSGALTCIYSIVPTRVSATSDEIPISDVYETAIWAFVIGSAYAKNTTRGDIQKSDKWMSMCAAFVSGKTQSQIADAPSTTLKDPTQ